MLEVFESVLLLPFLPITTALNPNASGGKKRGGRITAASAKQWR